MNNAQKLVFLLAINFLPVTLFGQNSGAITLFSDGRPEVYFKFAIHSYTDLRKASTIVSVVGRKGDTVYAYANTLEFANFRNFGWPFELLTAPSLLVKPSMRGDVKGIQLWNSYPTYPAYIQMMHNYASNYPSLCKLDTIGTSVKGRLLLFLEISNHPGTSEAKPEFMYSSTIHGDEPTGYVLMLRLIDYLIGNYNKDSLVTGLVNRMHIWINPLANPDGTYYGGDSTLQGARRGNFNGYDLNRNFPDPLLGPYPGGTRQPETQAMINFMQQHRFVMSANFHTGAEVVNYPWDSWESAQKTHADDAWFQLISKQFADTAHKFGPSAYFTDPVGDGYVNGGDWYVISGGRQDYITYFLNGREVTIELSGTYIPSGSDLPIYWEACYRSFLHYMEHATYGIHGLVSDNKTDKPLRAQIEIPGHDKDNSEVYSDSIHGYYTRLIAQGSYNLFFSAPGYYSRLMKGINVINYQATSLDVKLLSSAGNQFPPIFKDQFGHVKDTVTIDLLPDSSQQECFHISDPEGQLAWISSAQSVSGKISPVLSFCDTCLTFIPDKGFTGNDNLRLVLCDNANPALCDTVWIIARINNPGMVPENVNPQSLRIYPNPFKDHINIDLTTIPGNNCYISLINITGRKYFLRKIDTKNLSINAESLPNGMYYLLFYSGHTIIHSCQIIKIE